MIYRHCPWCGKRIWFWQTWEITPTSHCEMSNGMWVCSSACWEAYAVYIHDPFNRIMYGDHEPE